MSDRLPRLPRRADVDLERFHQGAVVNPGALPRIVALNPTALALWELCDGQTEVDEMVEAVCDLFAVDPVRARTDVVSALVEMRAAGVIS